MTSSNKILVGVAVLSVVAGTYFLAPRLMESTDAFSAAQDYVRSDLAVRARVGNVKQIEVDRNKRQSVVWGEGGTARLGVAVLGDKGTARVSLELHQDNGKWIVKRASLD